jgi:erythronate-4-phosphate dehydrogenase
MKIVADDKIPFLKGVLEPFSEMVYLPGQLITRDNIMDADALLIRTRTKCTGALLDGTGVRFIGTATIGYDHIDTRYCEMHKISWTNAPGCNSSSVQQYIAAALLKIADYQCFELKEKTLGIIGAGNVGSKVEKFARTIGMNVILNDPPRARKEGIKNFSDLNKVLNESDIVTVHVPLNMEGEDRTFHLFGEAAFRKLKNNSWFINSSRGEVTETSALKKALYQGSLGGAVLDVWENEPDIDTELMAKTLISTPHIAGYSTDGKANGTSMVVNALCKKFKLPLYDWSPANIPQPENSIINIAAEKKTDQEILWEAVAGTYNIDTDSISLRNSPSYFEKLRGDYRVRREFPAFTVKLSGGGGRIREILKDLGFVIY